VSVTKAKPSNGKHALKPEHVAYLAERGVQLLAKDHGYSSTNRGIAIPLHRIDGTTRLGTVRLDKPITKTVKGKEKTQKCDSPAGVPNELHVPPQVLRDNVLADPSKLLYITESIVKADAIVEKGGHAVAINGVQGWRATNEFNATLPLPEWDQITWRSKDKTIRRPVIYVPDSDLATKHQVIDAVARLRSFLRHRGADITVKLLPELTPGKNTGVDDWLAAGHKIAEIAELPDYNPDFPHVLPTALDIRRNPPERKPMDIDGILMPADPPMWLIGAPEAFKTWIALEMCRCVLTADKLFGYFQVNRKFNRVLYLNVDTGSESFQLRVLRITMALTDDQAARFHAHTLRTWDKRAFRALLRQYPGAFVVIDVWAAVYEHDPKAEIGEQMRREIREYRQMYEDYDCQGLILDHTRRVDDDFYGSQQKLGTIRQMFVAKVDKRPEEGDTAPYDALVTLTNRKASEYKKPQEFNVAVNFDNDKYTISMQYAGRPQTGRDQTSMLIAHAIHEFLMLQDDTPPKDIARGLAESENTGIPHEARRKLLQGDDRIGRTFTKAVEYGEAHGMFTSLGTGRGLRLHANRDYHAPDLTETQVEF
jgi:AAA domain/Domain of unknown function (DUF3854)